MANIEFYMSYFVMMFIVLICVIFSVMTIFYAQNYIDHKTACSSLGYKYDVDFDSCVPTERKPLVRPWEQEQKRKWYDYF